jgi:nuclear pore complex protein Nup98-Nup96
MLIYLSGNDLKLACDVAQAKGDHYAVLLASQNSGNNSCTGQLTLQQLDRYCSLYRAWRVYELKNTTSCFTLPRWQEAKADQFIGKHRLQVFAQVAGVPVWNGSKLSINCCDGYDWLRSFGMHLWYFTSPSASVSDALALYEDAFLKGDPSYGHYAAPPRPSKYKATKDSGLKICTNFNFLLNIFVLFFILIIFNFVGYDTNNEESEVYDLKYHLLKLYSNRTHPIERIVTPTTHTPDHLDHRLGWFIAQVLRALGYRHLSDVKSDQVCSSGKILACMPFQYFHVYDLCFSNIWSLLPN